MTVLRKTKVARQFNGLISKVLAAKHLVTSLSYLVILFCFSSSTMAHSDGKASGQDEREHEELRIVMSAAFVSESGIKVYDELASYLQEKLKHKVTFVSGFSYATINAMLDSGMADIGFICGLPYIMKRDVPEPNIDLLLAPVVKAPQYKNKPIYYSYLIVKKDSKAESFLDFRGKTFVYNDEISNSGYNMPRAYLIDLGETHGFFGEVVRSGSHEESIRMVALGKADISAVDSIVYDYDLIKNPEHVSQTRILKVLGPAGIPPVVVSTRLSLPLRKKIRDVFLGMKNDPAGKLILEKALLDRFDIVDDSNYNGIRKMQKHAQDSGYLVIR